MAAVVDMDISDSGEATFSVANVAYTVLHITDIGLLARELDPANVDRFAHIGFFAFGDLLNVIGATDVEYWRDPIWINFLDTLWTPIPSTSGGSPLTLVTSRVRWGLFGGATGHIYVYAT